MPPKQLLRATCLLLLSAAVFGRTILSDEVAASISAMPMASIPAEIHPAAVNCVKRFGPDGCLWNATCNAQILNCLLCERPGANFECRICRPGFYEAGVASCFPCPYGHFCGGNHEVNACDGDDGAGAGYTTNPANSGSRWSAQQCTFCLPGFGNDVNSKTCKACSAGEFTTRPDTLPCSFCPDELYSNSVSGATDCVLPANCPAGTTAVNNLRSCGCLAGTIPKLPTNEPFNTVDGPFFNVSANSTFFTPVRLPTTNSLVPFPVSCSACSGNTATSLSRPDLAGAVQCLVCPANSRPAVGIPTVGANLTPDRSTCVCNAGYVANGGNSAQCTARNIQCPTGPRAGVTLGGCVPDGTVPPGTIPTPTPGGGGTIPTPTPGDNNKQEWGHWHHKKHHKHNKHEEEEESEYYSTDKDSEYYSTDKDSEYESDKEKYLN